MNLCFFYFFFIFYDFCFDSNLYFVSPYKDLCHQIDFALLKIYQVGTITSRSSIYSHISLSKASDYPIQFVLFS